MRGLVTSVGWRYFAIAAQFVVVVLVARQASLETAGVYFTLFGLVAVAFVVAGLGAPDSLVRFFPRLAPSDAEQRLSLLVACVAITIAVTFVGGVCGVLIAGLLGAPLHVAILVAFWWASYSVTFAVAQVFIAFDVVTIGAFVAYSSINVTYMFTVVPYLLVGDVTLEGLLCFAVLGSSVSTLIAFIGLAFLVSSRMKTFARKMPAHRSVYLSARLLVSAGLPIAGSRLIQASLPWAPVWALTLVGTPAQSAIYSAASRLAVIATAVIAAIRFSSRPKIVAMLAAEDVPGLEKLARRINIITALPPILVLIFLGAAGERVVPAVFGLAYAPAVPIIAVLMVGVLFEAAGGISDEILKMSGGARVVLGTLGAAAIMQVGCSFLVAPTGAFPMAFLTAGAFALQYSLQILWLRIFESIHLWPFPSRRPPGQVGASA